MADARVIVWDWNGTLLDDTQAAVGALNLMLARRALPPITRAFYRAHFAFPVRQFYQAIGVRLEDEDWDALAREYHDSYARQPKAPMAGARAALDRVREAGAGQVLLSASRQDLLERDVAAYGLSDCFAFICGTDNLDGASKLDRARALVADLTHLKPDGLRNVVMIGDALHDREVADALGVRCVLFAGGSHSAERLAGAAPLAETLDAAVGLALSPAPGAFAAGG